MDTFVFFLECAYYFAIACIFIYVVCNSYAKLITYLFPTNTIFLWQLIRLTCNGTIVWSKRKENTYDTDNIRSVFENAYVFVRLTEEDDFCYICIHWCDSYSLTTSGSYTITIKKSSLLMRLLMQKIKKFGDSHPVCVYRRCVVDMLKYESK